MIFTSGDRLHENISPLFLREDQEFLWAPKLKEDLGRLDAHYDKLPESTSPRNYAICLNTTKGGGLLDHQTLG
jgi:hypothetical protein